MNKYCYQWIENWCQENGWTDLFVERRDYWAFPPGAVMPLPIPQDALNRLKSQYGMTPQERIWCGAAWLTGIAGIAMSFVLKSPMPLVTAFASCAVIVALLEDE